MLSIPGAMDAGLGNVGFYAALAVSLVVAGVAAFPANRWLVSRARGHAAVHHHHRAHRRAAGARTLLAPRARRGMSCEKWCVYALVLAPRPLERADVREMRALPPR